MSLFISSLNSGSNGNCYYIGNGKEAVLIDAGISCRETEKRMKRSGLFLEQVKAIFVSHEHSDHINGVRVLSKKYNLPVYITKKTLKNSGLILEERLIKSFKADQPVQVGGLVITAFSKFHDADDPHSFIVEGKGIYIGVLTDIGRVCENTIRHFKKCHAAFLEANYDADMLEKGGYPYYLKKRISGGHGHLSNLEALNIFNEHRPPFMSHVLLSHLSQNNNDPALVHQLFSKHAGKTNVVVASRYEETEVFEISDSPIQKIKERRIKVSQLTLF